MDARAVSKLSAKRNRFWGMPLPGRVVDRKRCELSPNRARVDAVLRELSSLGDNAPDWTYRVNPKVVTVSEAAVAARR